MSCELPRSKIVLIGLALCCVVSCATPTEVIKLYRASSFDGAPYERIFVVNVSPDRQQQVEFETEILRRFQVENVEAVAAHRSLDTSNDLQQTDLDRVVANASADAVLITHIASLDTTVGVDEDRTEVVSECRGGNPLDYFLYDRVTITEPGSVRFAHTVTVVSNLYDARTRERLWTIQSTCFEKSTMPEVIRDEAVAIVRQLKIDDLI